MVNFCKGRFDQKAAIITGGAKGIGRATALRFLREGGSATILETEPADGEWATSLKKEAEASGARLLYIQGDVTNESVVKSAVKQSMDVMGAPDILINNVGFSMIAAPLEDLSLQQWDHAFSVNVTSAFLLSREVIPSMRA